MTRPKRTLCKVFDPRIGDLVAEYETTSDRLYLKLTDQYDWCLCELCGQRTEFALATSTSSRGFYKRNGTEVPLSPEICAKSEKIADALAVRYEQALMGKSSEDPNKMILKYCGIDGFRELQTEELRDRSDRNEAARISVKQFWFYAEGQARMALWAKRADFVGARKRATAAKSKGDVTTKPSRLGEPSRLYCARHNQVRSEEARRTYQRDIERVGEYYELISRIWSEHAGQLPAWDIEAHAHVRQEAYRILQEQKPRQKRLPASLIDQLIKDGIANQSEIAKRLGVSRQAISAAIKRRGLRQN